MSPSENRPVPLIDLMKCNGCNLCVRACPTEALALNSGKVVIANPQACEYHGQCEAICPTQAIWRPFEIVLVGRKKNGS